MMMAGWMLKEKRAESRMSTVMRGELSLDVLLLAKRD
jgi:hypothetical protein